MINLQEFKNGMSIGENLIFLADDINDSLSFGYTENIEKVKYNMALLKKVFTDTNHDDALAKSKNGLTTLFPLGRYIVILLINKEKTEMKMFFLDFRIEYSVADKGFAGIFSNNIKLQFKKIKYYMEESFNEDFDNIALDASLEPTF